MSDEKKIDNGGAAFPVEHGIKRDGMSLRDYFAAAEKIDSAEDYPWAMCEALAGPRPKGCMTTNPLEWLIWSATWQAKIKFIRANAMLAARREGNQP